LTLRTGSDVKAKFVSSLPILTLIDPSCMLNHTEKRLKRNSFWYAKHPQLHNEGVKYYHQISFKAGTAIFHTSKI